MKHKIKMDKSLNLKRFTTLLIFWGILIGIKAQTCGDNIFIDTFDGSDALPTEWTEFNTAGQVTVEDGRLKFDLNAQQPSAYRTFSPESKNVTISFTEESTRNYVKCRFDVISSEGKYLTSILFGNNGAGTVQYATDIDGSGLPTSYIGTLIDHTYKKNYEYSFSIALDFSTNTFNFYADGLIGGQNLPFIEPVSNVAKLSITQISMYSGEGRFFFDNIALSIPGADRAELSSAIATATQLTESGIISPLYGYSPDNYQAMKVATEQASSMLQDCALAQTEIDAAATTLNTAITDYESSFKNEVVLKAYEGYNFSGKEYDVYCGYYNGNLDTLDNKIVSFKLEKGYMATFAQDVDGLGFSKVYIAQDNALEINLPEQLQRSISFMRVSPWYVVGKKGSLGKKPWSDPENYNAEWYYNWGMGVPDQNSGFSTPEVQYVPMSWSKGDFWTGTEPVQRVGKNMALNNHMAFNEPDNSGQSNLTVEAALEAYPKLLASGLRLGAPGVENVQYNTKNDSFASDGWIKQFMDSCVARGYRVDFIPAHDYIRRSTAQYIERFKALYDRYGIPVWVTEYNYGNPNMGSANITEEVGYNKISAITQAFEEADFIERYNWYYFFGASTGIGGISNDTLNSIGKFYRDFESPAPSYIQEEYEQGPYITLGVKAVKTMGDVEVYPNPANGNIINLKYASSLTQEATIRIYNVHGKEVFMQNNASKQLNIKALPNGLYILHVSTRKGAITQKLIIDK